MTQVTCPGLARRVDQRLARSGGGHGPRCQGPAALDNGRHAPDSALGLGKRPARRPRRKRCYFLTSRSPRSDEDASGGVGCASASGTGSSVRLDGLVNDDRLVCRRGPRGRARAIRWTCVHPSVVEDARITVARKITPLNRKPTNLGRARTCARALGCAGRWDCPAERRWGSAAAPGPIAAGSLGGASAVLAPDFTRDNCRYRE